MKIVKFIYPSIDYVILLLIFMQNEEKYAIILSQYKPEGLCFKETRLYRHNNIRLKDFFFLLLYFAVCPQLQS